MISVVYCSKRTVTSKLPNERESQMQQNKSFWPLGTRAPEGASHTPHTLSMRTFFASLSAINGSLYY